MKTCRVLALFCISAGVIHATTPTAKAQQMGSSDRVPEGLATSDWSGILAAYKAGQHAFQSGEGGWLAYNPGQNWTTKFDGRGFVAEPKDGGWQWGLELKSYGFAGNERNINGQPTVKAEGQRLSYQWDATIQEWWVNDTRGLEHGFSLSRRPETGGSDATAQLQFDLRVRGTLKPQIAADGLGVAFHDAAGALVLNYAGLKVWDADGKVLPSHFTAAPVGVRLLVDDRDACYPLTIDPTAQQAYLKASNNGVSYAFGSAVAISGDTVVVGAGLEETNGANYAGAAYVFVRNETTWTQQAYLTASNGGANDFFGRSVSVSGDTIVVGAIGEAGSGTGVDPPSDDGANFAGAAYVFVRSGTTWSQQAYLKASNTGAGDQFGISVAVSSDTVFVGAKEEDGSGTGVNPGSDDLANNAGAAYVFTRTGTTWAQQAYLKASNTGAGDNFGWSTAVWGDTVVVGAVNEDGSGTGVNPASDELSSGAGAAYVFVRSGTSWSQQAYLKPLNTGAGDFFGASVALWDDTAAIGTPNEDGSGTGVNPASNEGATDAGAAYVFTRTGTTWAQQAYLKASNTGAGDGFGNSVAVTDGAVVVGALFEDGSGTGVTPTSNNSANDAGAAYVFAGSGTVWSHQAYLKASNTDAGDRFGGAVAVSGETVVVAAAQEDGSGTGANPSSNEGATDSGAAYTFIGLGSAPQINVNQSSVSIADGGSTDFGTLAVGSTADRVFTIQNTGFSDLLLSGTPKVIVSGPDAALFTVVSQPTSPVVSNSSTNFTVRFTPTIGSKTAALSIANNDSNENPFDIALTGTGLNNSPTISDILDQTIDEDANTGPLSFNLDDVETMANSLTLSGTSSNTTLVPNSNITFSGSGEARTVTVTPVANLSGTATINVTVSDGTDSVTETFLLTVTSVNDVPTISNIPDRTINEDESTGALAFVIGDVETSATSLSVTRASSNTTLVPTDSIVLSGSGANRTITATPAANLSGAATITITVSDGEASANSTFLLTVNAVDDPPTISNISDQSIGVNTLTNSLPFTLSDVETPVAALIVSGTSSNLALVKNANIFFGGSGASRTVTVVPEANQIGTVTISVSVSDGVLTDTDTFVVTVLGADIAVEQPFNSGIADGGTKSFGSVPVGMTSSLNFVIKNTGNANLTGLTVTKDGADAGMFTVTANPTAPVNGPNGTTAFTVRFAPTSAGLKTAEIHIFSNDPDESPFDITLTGTTPGVPEIAVERSGVNIADGGSAGIATTAVGSPVDAVFTLRNTGNAALSLTGTPSVVVSGTDATLFSVITQPSSSVEADGSTTFAVRYTATDSSGKTATLTIANDDGDENPFDINLTGQVLSFTNDTDADGISDASELQMAALGFDWQVHQASLVNTYTSSANGVGYFTAEQVQALNVGTPLIQRDPSTSKFTLTIGLEKSVDLSTFLPFPMTAPNATTINPDGKLEFQFTVPDNAAFFQLKAQ